MPITLEQGKAMFTLRLEGEINIESASELKDLLLQALASGRKLRFNLQNVTRLDVTTVQLLWVAQREAAASGLELRLHGPMPDEIAVALDEVGFSEFLAVHK